MNEIHSQRIGAGTFFKLLLVGGVFTHILLVVVVMIGVSLGLITPAEVDNPMSVWKSELFLLGFLVIGIVFVLFWVGILWLCIYPGVWLYSKFKPMTLFYMPVKGNCTNT